MVVSEVEDGVLLGESVEEELGRMSINDIEEIEMDITDVKILRDYIEKKMNMNQKLQVIDMIKKANAKYSKNKNGYFVNMNNVPKDLLMRLKLLVDFTKENMKELIKTEEILNEEKSKIEGLDKEESWTVGEDNIERNINYEIYSMEGNQSEIFEEFKEDDTEELEFMSREFLDEKRDNAGYKILLKKYKRKYLGNKAKILKRFRDISKNSISNKSNNTPTVKKKKRVIKKDLKKVEETETNNQEDTFADDEEELED